MPPRFSQRFWPTSSKPLTTMLDLHPGWASARQLVNLYPRRPLNLPWGTAKALLWQYRSITVTWEDSLFLGTSDFLGYILTLVHCVPTSGSAYLLACLFLSIIKPLTIPTSPANNRLCSRHLLLIVRLFYDSWQCASKTIYIHTYYIILPYLQFLQNDIWSCFKEYLQI